MTSEKLTGTVVVEKGEYFLEMPSLTNRRKKELIPIGPEIDKKSIEPLAGTKVEVLLSEPQQFVAGIVGPEHPTLKKIRILCYIPRPDRIGTFTVDPVIKDALIKQFIGTGIISKEIGEQLRAM